MSSTVKIILCAGLLAATAAARASSGTISLEGTWQFGLDPNDTGNNEKWFDRDLPQRIRLPGALQAQGYGDEISIDTPWVLSLYDHLWFLRDDYRAYTNAGHVKVPFLCQPPRHYLGAAWYRREIEIPAGWESRRIVLFLERPHWETRVWLDGAPLGTNLSLCAPHQYQLGTALKAGRHSLAIRVDNRLLLPYRPDAHSVSDSLGGAWNGIVGKIELRSTPGVWLDTVDLYPIPNETNKVRVVARLGNVSGQAGKGEIRSRRCMRKSPSPGTPVAATVSSNATCRRGEVFGGMNSTRISAASTFNCPPATPNRFVLGCAPLASAAATFTSMAGRRNFAARTTAAISR